MRRIRIGRASGFSMRRATRVRTEGLDLAVFVHGTDVIAVDNICPHQHHAILHECQPEDGVITCPMHGWRFSLVTGAAVGGSGNLTRLPVIVSGDDVYVEVE